MSVKIKTALISVFYKEGLASIVKQLHALEIRIISTGGTLDYINDLGIPVTPVSQITGYPSILGGRVKTLHPAIFGGILSRKDVKEDEVDCDKFDIQDIELVIVDLYPFKETVNGDATENEVIEKIDIGGISLIRAAAKNFKKVLTVSSRDQYVDVLKVLSENKGSTSIQTRKRYAGQAFARSSQYDQEIQNYFMRDTSQPCIKINEHNPTVLRYGENPHQKGYFFGNIDAVLGQHNGRKLSYNNILDIESAISLISEFQTCTFAILKHNNACGLATRSTVKKAFIDALAGDPISAFGGVLICNREIDLTTALEIDQIFYEVVIAPAFSESAMRTLTAKKNRIVLIQKKNKLSTQIIRTALNGYLLEDRDMKVHKEIDFKIVTDKEPSNISDLLFANKIVKHTKSNAIVLVKMDNY